MASLNENQTTESNLVRHVMTRDVQLLNSDQTVAEAARLMRDEGIGAVPIAQDEKVVGMVTDRDIVIRLTAEARDPTLTSLREIMTDGVLSCFEDETCDSVAKKMGEHQVRRLHVVGRDKQLVGIVSLGDLTEATEVEQTGEALEEISKSSE